MLNITALLIGSHLPFLAKSVCGLRIIVIVAKDFLFAALERQVRVSKSAVLAMHNLFIPPAAPPFS
jgi:hypothetical protein